MSIDLSRPSSCAGEDFDSLLGENSDAVPSRRDSLTQTRLQQDRIPLADDNDDTEDQTQMDLVLNTNFDLGMFDYNWSDDTTTNIAAINTINSCDIPGNNGCDDGIPNCEDVSLSPTTRDVQCSAKRNNALHPQAIQSSADCPPIATSVVSLKLSTDGSAQGVQNIGAIGLTQLHNTAASSDRSNQNQSFDWNTIPSNSVEALDAVPTTSTTINADTDSYLLSSQLQELIARQAVAPLSNSTANTASAVPHPPFLLFDAPIELRANFIASQRAHGFPILDDNNAFHYQHTPQFSQQLNAVAPEVHLVDGRHGGIRNKRVKNEREQKRTQKITDLIDQLRDKMEEGGWKVGGTKSKYATLSTCAEYVKHLVNSTKEQELALEKTKQDLEAKRRIIEDDNEYQQDPSDPESTISSLTVSSCSAELPTDCVSSGENSNLKRGMSSCYDTRKAKLPRTRDEKESQLTEICSISPISKGMSCKPSDKVSLSGESARNGSNAVEESSKSSCSQTFGGVSSVGAVARGLHSRAPRGNHPDVIVKGYKKRSSIAEATSMDSSFKLDYEEVFVKSSVPQLLATTAGRIVAWNDIFLKASGLLALDIDSVTIFSLVRQTELVKLFEIVAATLRSGTMHRDKFDSCQNLGENVQPSDANKAQQKTHATDYTAITLPCATFRPRTTPHMNGEVEALEKLLYMTITLMSDRDPKKRCFHCVFTDSPGTNGALGSVTPELLSILFNNKNNMPIVDGSANKNIKANV